MNKLVKYLSVPLLAVTFFLFTACPSNNNTPSTTIDPSAVQSGVAIATQAGLQFAVSNSATRQNIANYVYVYANAVRSVTGTPSPDQLTQYLNTFIPQDIKTKYPEIPAFLTPMIVTRYTTIYQQFSGDAKTVYQYLNAIATGLEQGAQSFVTSPSPTPAGTPATS